MSILKKAGIKLFFQKAVAHDVLKCFECIVKYA